MLRFFGRIVAAGLMLVAGATQAQVVISQVYAGGGEAGAVYRSDFIELHNIGNSAVDVTGWSVQYADANSTSWKRTLISGSIPSGGYILVPALSGGDNGAELPSPNALPVFLMNGAAGKVVLTKNQNLLGQNCITSPSTTIADFVGYGVADCAESAPASAPTPTLATARSNNGCSDINNNFQDFVLQAPTPRNSQSAPQVCIPGPLPTLTISGASAPEGNDSDLGFSAQILVSLSAPAPAGGVSFNASTSNGTATAGFPGNQATDYIAQNWEIVIAEGQTMMAFVLPIVGDTRFEPDETLSITISDLQGAIAANTVGVYTILNDDTAVATISEVQGSGRTSPFTGQLVSVEGIVTAHRTNDGFFLQSAADDGNPATSEGIFVSTDGIPPTSAAVGNRVRVDGKVVEFIPGNDLNQRSVTQIVSPTIQALASGVALPAPVTLTSADFNSDSTPDTAEKYEGMRVNVAEARVIEGSGATIDAVNASAINNGDFYVVLPGVGRPFRESGIGVLDTVPIPADKNPPRFDTNPERLMIRSRGQPGADAVAADVDADVAGLVGILDYAHGTWAVLPDASVAIAVTGGKQPRAVPDARNDEITIASLNLDRLSDEIDNGNGAVQLTPAALDKRLTKASAAICDYLKAPDILGVQEVENLRVLEMLANRINSSCPRTPAYRPYLLPSPEARGRNVGVLLSSRSLPSSRNRVVVDQIAQEFDFAFFADPDFFSFGRTFERAPLRLSMTVNHENGPSYPLTVYLNHFTSLDGIDSTAPGPNGWAMLAERVRMRRAQQAFLLTVLVRQRQTANPNERIVLLGDFNAFDFNDGYTDVMSALAGEPAPQDQSLTPAISRLLSPMVRDSEFVADPAERYSSISEGNAQALEHILISDSILTGASAIRVDYARINADFGAYRSGDANSAIRVSERDPIRMTIRVPEFRSADLSARIVDIAPASPHVGQPIAITVAVDNAGSSDAEFPAISFITDAVLPYDIQTSAPAGWTCQTRLDPFLTYACTAPRLAAGESATMTAQFVVPVEFAGRTFSFATATHSQTPDSNSANNIDSRTIAPLAESDLSARWGGDLHLPFYSGSSRWFSMYVKNDGPDPDWNPAVVFTADAPTGTIEFYSDYWSCYPDYSSVTVKTDCYYNSFYPSGSLASGAEAEFAVRVFAPLPDPDGLNLVATVIGTGTDPNLENNEALLSMPVTLAQSDLSVQWTKVPTAPLRSGLINEFALTLNNAGPDPAQRSSLVITADAPVNDVILEAPASWACTPDYSDFSRFVAECINPDDQVAVGTSAVFNLQVRTPLPDADGLNLSATISSIGADDNPSNDSSTRSVPVVLANADLSARWSGNPEGPYRAGDIAEFELVLDNHGTDAAWAPSVTISVDAPFENVTFNDSGYWSCEGDYSTANFKINCLYGLEFAPGLESPNVFILNVIAPSRDKDKLNLNATIDSAYVKDTKASNNTASRRVNINGPN